MRNLLLLALPLFMLHSPAAAEDSLAKFDGGIGVIPVSNVAVNATTGAVTGSAPAAYGAFAQGLPIPPQNSYTNPSGAVTAAEYPHFRSTYLEQFNLTVEHEFGGFVGSLGYVGELGRRMGDTAKQATDEMRVLIERAIREGTAQRIR